VFKRGLIAVTVAMATMLSGCFLWEEEGDCTVTCASGNVFETTTESESECLSYCNNVCSDCASYRYEETSWF
jgi:hypothetical protein